MSKTAFFNKTKKTLKSKISRDDSLQPHRPYISFQIW